MKRAVTKTNYRPAATPDLHAARDRAALEDRLRVMAERGVAASGGPAQAWCQTCGPKQSLTAVIAGHVCERCKRVFVDVEHNGIKARVVVEEAPAKAATARFA